MKALGSRTTISYVPVADSKRHGVSDDNHSNECIRTDRVIAIDQIVYAESNAHCHGEGQASHCNTEAHPVDSVLGTDTPENQGAWHYDHA